VKRPLKTITALIPSTTVLVSVSTATSVTSPVVSSTAVLSTETIFSTTSTETITIIASTETEVSILGTSYNTVIVQTNDVTDILATDTVFSTSTILTTVVSNNVISLPTGTETYFTAVATATSTNVATFTAPAIAPRAVATLKSLGSSLVSTYGVTRVSSACSCILTSAASVQTILVTVSAPSYTLTQTVYTTATSVENSAATITQTSVVTTVINVIDTTTIYALASQTSSVITTEVDFTTIISQIDATATSTLYYTYTTSVGAIATSEIEAVSTITDYFEATVTLPTTLETIVSATTTTTPVPVPTGFALRISSPGHIYDGTYVSVTFNGVAIYMGSTPTSSTASTFILSTPQNYNNQITYTGVPKYINSSSLWNNYIMVGSNNTPQEIITLYQASFLGVGDTTATHNPLQCVFTGPGKYAGTLLCSVKALASQYNTLFSLYTTNPTGVLITRTINVGTQQAQLIGVPLF
jgi:hypothetical protein